MTTQALNRPVDVLRVMRDAAHELDPLCFLDDRSKKSRKLGTQLDEARAAVAELIEAARGATEERYHNGASSKAACDRLVAVLARIGGTP